MDNQKRIFIAFIDKGQKKGKSTSKEILITKEKDGFIQALSKCYQPTRFMQAKRMGH